MDRLQPWEVLGQASASVKLRFRVGSPGRQARIDVCLRGPCPTQLSSCPLLKPFWKNSEFPGYPVPQFNNLSSLKAGVSVYLSIYHDPNLPKADFAVQLWEPCLTSLCSRWVSKPWLCSLYTTSVCLLCCSQQGLLTQRTDFLQPTAEATRAAERLVQSNTVGLAFPCGGMGRGLPRAPRSGAAVCPSNVHHSTRSLQPWVPALHACSCLQAPAVFTRPPGPGPGVVPMRLSLCFGCQWDPQQRERTLGEIEEETGRGTKFLSLPSWAGWLPP